MKKMIFTAAMTALLFASCAKDEIAIVGNNNPEMVPFEVELENELASSPDAKAYLNASDLSLVWYGGDEFSVFDGVVTTDGGTKFTISEGGSTTSCKLSGEISPSASGPIYFLYPYQVFTATRGRTNSYKTNISSGIIFPVNVPYKYETQPNFLPAKSLMMVGKMPSKDSTDPVTMKTPMGFVKFHLDAGDMHPVTKIELTYQLSAFLGGAVAVDYTGSDPAIIMQGSGTGVFAGHPALSANQQAVAYDIVVTPKGAEAFPDGDYYFALPPQTYTKGIRLKFTDDMGYVAQKSGSSDLVVSRAKVKDLGTVVSDDLDWYESIDLVFMDHCILSSLWPFNETKVSSFAKNSVNTFTYGPDEDVFIVKNGNYDAGVYSQTGLNLRGAPKDAYLEIPGRTGKRIAHVYLRVSGTGANCGNPLIATTEPEKDGKLNILKLDGTFGWLTVGVTEDNLLMDAWWSNKQYGWQKHWANFDVEGEKNYRIYVSSSSDALKMVNLLIQYEDL